MDVIKLRISRWSNGALLALMIAFILTEAAHPAAPEPPAIPLSQVYQPGVDVGKYWVSEKLDGVRARWDGSRLISRNGNVYMAPDWFTAGFPQIPLDGELWMGRNSFERLVGTVRREDPQKEGWPEVRYMVFDLPLPGLTFSERLARLRTLFSQLDSPFIRLVEQYRVSDHRSLMQRLEQIVAAGGEGLMLHLASADYRPGRNSDLLKVKPYLDAEARVIARLPGKGKYQGLMGALLVESSDGKRFRIGSGYTDAQRRNPPPTGALVSYRYYGLTEKGIPRFASFIRVREVE